MAQNTTYRRSLSGSIGSGVKSVFSGEGRRYYSLVHKVSSKYHRAGESQKIIVDQIELGRDPRCAVRYDESFGTVSRRHAAIVKDGDNWKLVPLSKTNSTYLNGRKLEKEWYLQNGDEIQLSTNGPKLGFIVPEGKAGLVKSIGLTARLSLFRQQALRPYKTAITSLACALVLCCGLGGYFLIDDRSTINLQNDMIVDLQELTDSLKKANELAEKKIQESLRASRKASDDARRAIKTSDSLKYTGASSFDFSSLYGEVFFLQISTFYVDGKEYTCPNNLCVTGTGFLLKDGRFVTARHCVQPHLSFNNLRYSEEERKTYLKDPTEVNFWLLKANVYAQDGRKVDFEIRARSKGGSYTFRTSDCVFDDSGDVTLPFFGVTNVENGTEVSKIKIGNFSSISDCAYVKTNLTGGLDYTSGESWSLPQGTQLTILGYPHSMGASALEPVLSTAICSQNGVDKETQLLFASNDNTEGGNSGGPVFIVKTSGASVVGIVSGSNNEKGRFVPLDAIDL